MIYVINCANVLSCALPSVMLYVTVCPSCNVHCSMYCHQLCHWLYHHYHCSFVTKISAMGPYEEGEAIDSISFLKESDKYSLHQILWDNEDHLSNAIIAMRLVLFQILILEWKLVLFCSQFHTALSAFMTRLGTSLFKNWRPFWHNLVLHTSTALGKFQWDYGKYVYVIH